MTPTTIVSVISDAFESFSENLWLLAPIGLGIMAIRWGVPVGVRFVKSLSK